MSKCKITGKVLSVRMGREETQMLLLGGNSEILYSAAVPTPAGAVEDGMIRNQDAVRDMLKTALQAPEFKRVKQVVFALCTTQVITEKITTPDLPAAKLEKLLQSNADMYFPVDTKDYQMVWEVLGPKGDGSLKEVEVQLWAVPIAMITRYYTVANACGLSVAAIDYCGHAIATAVGATFARPARKAAKQAKQKKKLDLNAEISFGKKKQEAPAEEAEPADIPLGGSMETELHLLLENDLLGMTFVQNGQVVLQRFIRCGSDPSFQFGELAMMVEYFRTMDIGRGSTVRGIVSGELAKDKYVVGDLEDTLGMRLSLLDISYEPPWCLCFGAAHTTIDFGAPSLNAPGLSRRHMQSQLGQYVAILACGLVLVAVILFTMTAKLGWDTELGILRANQQTLMMTSAKYSGFADNYYEYEKMYTQYSQDWDTIFYNLQTYNDNMVRVLEELEELVPEKTSVTSMQMVSNALNVTFACSNKEEAAYLIMALREMQYADLIAVSSLSGGGRGAAESYGDPNYQRGEKPPTEGGASIEDVTVTITPETAPATEAPATGVTPSFGTLSAEEQEYFLFLYMSTGTTGYPELDAQIAALNPATPETTAPTEAPVPETTAPATEAPATEPATEPTTAPTTEPSTEPTTAPTEAPEGGDFLTMLKGYLKNYFENGTTGIPYFDVIIEEQISKYLREGKTDYPDVDSYIESAMAAGTLDSKVDTLLNKYITDGTTGITAADTVLVGYLTNATTGNPKIDEMLKNYIWAGKADDEIAILYARYATDGKTGLPEIDALVEGFVANKTTGIPELDVKIKECIANYDPDTPTTEPSKPTEPTLPQAGIITQDSFLASLQLYISQGTTGIPVLDQMIAAYLNPPQGDSDSGKSSSSSGGTQVTDTRVFFSAVLGYNSELRNAELDRKGLNYTDKILPMEVNE